MAKTITALMVEPGKPPQATRLYTSKNYLSYAVSIGVRLPCDPDILFLEDNLGILYNSEAHLLDLEGNRQVAGQIVAGVFYVVGIDQHGQLTSLTKEQMEDWWMRLFDPETYTEQEVMDSAFGAIFPDGLAV